ncbi:MAG: hypothetical protein M3Z35_12750 [Nitrospirota bacterium]|nr:hypothetical protein [Nitrospirota bacterium]
MLYSRLLMSVVFTGVTGLMGPAYAADAADPELQVTDKNCWIEIFDDTEFDKDDPHVKLMGPKEYATLKDLSGRNWNNDIESVMVGPNATAKAYSKRDFAGTELAFTPNQRVPNLKKLDMGNEIESMKIMCGAPQ